MNELFQETNWHTLFLMKSTIFWRMSPYIFPKKIVYIYCNVMWRNIKHKFFCHCFQSWQRELGKKGIEPSESLRLELEAWQQDEPSQNWRPGSGMILPRTGGLAAGWTFPELEAWQRNDPSQNWRPAGSGMNHPRTGGLAVVWSFPELEAWQWYDPSQNWRPGSRMILLRTGGLAAEWSSQNRRLGSVMNLPRTGGLARNDPS